MNRFIRLDMNHQDDQRTEQANTNHALLAIVRALILKQHHRTGEYFFGIGEIQSVLDEVTAALTLGPSEFHDASYI